MASRLKEMFGVIWRRTVSNGVEWVLPMDPMLPMASMASMATVVAQEGIHVKALLFPRSWDAAIIAVIFRVNGVHELVTPRKLRRIAKS